MFFENLIEINLPINLEPTNSVLKFKPIPQYFPKSSFSHYSTYLKISTTFLNASSILRLNIFTSMFLPFSNKYLSYCYMLDTGRGTKKKKKICFHHLHNPRILDHAASAIFLLHTV